MADLTALHKSARTLILSLRDGMEQLERAETGGTFVHESSLKKTQTQRLADLQSISERMDSAWRMQSMRESAAKRDVWRRKVEQVSEEVTSLQHALDKHLQREGRRNAEARERAELLSRRSGQAGPGYAPGAWGNEAMADEQARGHVTNSSRMLEEAFETGSAILSSMAGQRERLKSAQRRALDVMNSVGLSTSLLRVIERRQRMDQIIVYGGMVAVIVILTLIWWFWRR